MPAGDELPVDERRFTLETIASMVRVCTSCRLHLNRTHAVPGEGSPTAALVLVGEAPGRAEDRTGQPFQGMAGRHLDDVLTDVGVARDDVFITSINKCRPPRNRPPLRDERDACRVLLDAQLATVRPPVLLAMGRIAAWSLVPGVNTKLTLDRLRSDSPYAVERGELFVTCHPAAALRFPAQRPGFAADVRAACEAAGLVDAR